MKKTTKRLLAFMLVGVMVSLLFIGCGKENKNTNDKKDKKDTTVNSEKSTDKKEDKEKLAQAPDIDTSVVETFTVFTGGNINWDNPVAEEITRRTGVKLQFEFALEDPQQKLAFMQASGQYSDIILNAEPALTIMIESGDAVKLTDLIDQYGPDIKAFYGDLYDRLRYSDGEIYSFGIGAGAPADMAPGNYWNEAFWIQNETLKNQGYPKVKTLADYKNIIKKELDSNPMTADGQKRYGLSLITSDNFRFEFSIINPGYLVNGLPFNGGYYIDPDTYEVSYSLQQPYMREFMRWYNELYNEGLMDPESFTQNYDTYLSKIANGRVIGIVDSYWQFSGAASQLRNNGQGNLTYMPFTPLVDPDNMVWSANQAGSVAGHGGFFITSACKNPAKIVNFFNFLASEEGQILTEWGVEGVNYTIDENGNRVRNPEDVEEEAKDSKAFALKTGVKLYARDYGQWLHQPFGYKTSNGQLLFSDDISNADIGFSPEEKETLGKYGFRYFTDAFPSPLEFPVRSYGSLNDVPLGADEEVMVAKQKFDDLRLAYFAKATMCKPDEFDGVWDEFMNKIDEIGGAKILEVMNEGVQTRLKIWGNK